MTPPKTPGTHLVLIRHAESLHNRDGDRVNLDSGLTELGWRQAHAVAGWLARRYRLDLLLSSSLVSARQTAEVVAARMHVPVTIEQGLDEAAHEYWNELSHKWDAPLDSWNSLWQPNLEESPLYASLRGRVRDTLARVIVGNSNTTILALTHRSVIATVLRSLFGGHHAAVFTANTGVTQFTWDENRWRLIFHNSTAHLETLSSPPPAMSAIARSAAPWMTGENAVAILEHYQRVAGLPPSEIARPSERELRDLVRLTEPLGDERLLDVGTGTGSVALAFAPHVASVLAVDLSPAMLEQAEAARAAAGVMNVHFRLGEIDVLSLPETSFDIITCHDLLQYATNLNDLLTLLRRLLATKGRLLIDEPVASEDPVKRATLNAIAIRRDSAVVRIWSAREIEAALHAAGLRWLKGERYSVNRGLDEWLSQAAADEVTWSAVTSMLEAGVDADAAGLNSRRGRDGAIIFTESRIRLLAESQAQPA